MSHTSTSMQTTKNGEQRGESNMRLQGRRLILAWVFWGIIALFELAALIYSLTGAVSELQVICTSSCAIQQLNTSAVETLQHAGLSIEDYIAFYIAVILISTLLCYILAAILLCAERTTGWHCWSRSC